MPPSHFRVEEQLQRGMAFAFAQRLVSESPSVLHPDSLHDFYNGVDNLFLVREEGELPIMFDHAFAYRHRNRRNYKYHNLTWHELTGVINLLYRKIVPPLPASLHGSVGPKPNGHTPCDASHYKRSPSCSEWDWMIEQVCGGSLAIDNRARLWKRLESNLPIALFAGRALQVEMELFVLQPVRARLGLKTGEAITDELLRFKGPSINGVSSFFGFLTPSPWSIHPSPTTSLPWI